MAAICTQFYSSLPRTNMLSFPLSLKQSFQYNVYHFFTLPVCSVAYASFNVNKPLHLNGPCFDPVCGNEILFLYRWLQFYKCKSLSTAVLARQFNSPLVLRWWNRPCVPRPLYLQSKHCSEGLNLDQPSLVWWGHLYCYLLFILFVVKSYAV
jgi:hypothetical protein